MEIKTTLQIKSNEFHPMKTDWVPVYDLLEFIKKHENSLGDLPIELAHLKSILQGSQIDN